MHKFHIMAVLGIGLGPLLAQPLPEAKAMKETVVNFEWKLKNTTLKITPGPQNTGPFERFCYYSISPKVVELGGTRPYHFRGTMMFYEFGEKEFVDNTQSFSGTTVCASPDEKTLFLDEDISNASGPNHTYILVRLIDKKDGAGAQYSHTYVLLPEEAFSYPPDAYDKNGKLIPDLHDTSPTVTAVSNEHLTLTRQDKKVIKIKLSSLKAVKTPAIE